MDKWYLRSCSWSSILLSAHWGPGKRAPHLLSVLSAAAPYCAYSLWSWALWSALWATNGLYVEGEEGEIFSNFFIYVYITKLRPVHPQIKLDCCQWSNLHKPSIEVPQRDGLWLWLHMHDVTAHHRTGISITIQIWLHWPNMNFLHSDISAYSHSSPIQMNLGVWRHMVKIGN